MADAKTVVACLYRVDFDLRSNEIYKSSTRSRRTLLMWAIKYSLHDLMIKCLQEKESGLNEKDNFGSLAIHFID